MADPTIDPKAALDAIAELLRTVDQEGADPVEALIAIRAAAGVPEAALSVVEAARAWRDNDIASYGEPTAEVPNRARSRIEWQRRNLDLQAQLHFACSALSAQEARHAR